MRWTSDHSLVILCLKVWTQKCIFRQVLKKFKKQLRAIIQNLVLPKMNFGRHIFAGNHIKTRMLQPYCCEIRKILACCCARRSQLFRHAWQNPKFEPNHMFVCHICVWHCMVFNECFEQTLDFRVRLRSKGLKKILSPKLSKFWALIVISMKKNFERHVTPGTMHGVN